MLKMKNASVFGSYSVNTVLVLNLLAPKQITNAIQVVSSERTKLWPSAVAGKAVTEELSELGAVLYFRVPQLCVQVDVRRSALFWRSPGC